jgi:hypothetical protein
VAPLWKGERKEVIKIRKFGKTAKAAKAVCKHVNETWWHNYKMTLDRSPV